MGDNGACWLAHTEIKSINIFILVLFKNLMFALLLFIKNPPKIIYAKTSCINAKFQELSEKNCQNSFTKNSNVALIKDQREYKKIWFKIGQVILKIRNILIANTNHPNVM